MATVCMVVVAAATAGMAQMMEPIIDDIFTQRREDMLVPVAIGVFAIFFAKGCAAYAQSVLMDHVGRSIIAELQIRMFSSLVRADLTDFHDMASGKLVSRFTHDVQQLYASVSQTLTGIGRDILTVIALSGVMIYQDWQLALIAAVTFPIALLPVARLARSMRKVSGKTNTHFGILTSQLSQVFQGIRHVKAYNAEDREATRINAVIWQVATLMQKAARIRAATQPIMEILGGLAIVGVILWGGWQVINDQRSPGSLFAFITALLLAYEPLKRLANLNTVLQQGLAAADRVFQTIDANPAITDRTGARRLSTVKGDIALDGVTFGYHGGPPALHDLSITVPAGSTVALVGPSGAGKSSVLNLIPRFYDVGAGRITLDGTDIRELELAWLRDQIALVSQDVTLFDDTIRNNIAYSRPGAPEDAIIEAAHNAAAHDFIADMPNGYDTMVGEQGVKLSGGQRQRLSIARAMLKNAPILLLDEATSALDTESERLVQDALVRLIEGRTTLVIAHRLSTIVNADRIYVLDDGRVAETGDHETLIARGGLYARLWSMQTAGQSAGSVVAAVNA